MSKTKQTKKFTGNMTPAMRALSTMKHKDIQLACILRGMDSKQMVESDHHDLIVFFTEHFEMGEDQTLLPIHWAWVEEELKGRGYKKGDILMSPSLRLGYVGDIEKMEKPISIKPPNLVPEKEKKPKAEMDTEMNVRKGTKKALTYQLTWAGKDLDAITKAVIKAFPEAQDKSIKIWHKRALNTKPD